MLAFITDSLRIGTPAQQLLDRFLTGYSANGKFQEGRKGGVSIHVTAADADKANIERRVKDFGLIVEASLSEALSRPDAVVLVGSPGAPVIEALRPGARCFVYGAATKQVLAATDKKNCKPIAGTAVRGAIQLPRIHPEASPAKALIVVQGTYPTAEIDALNGLLPFIPDWRRGTNNVQFLTGDNFWRKLKDVFWPLLKSAISRSDTPQGDAVSDGRTQDLARLGLVESLAKNPRGWLIESGEAFRCMLAVLDGVVADYNVALQTKQNRITSTQLYRPPPPAEHHYSNLAAMLDKFFSTGVPPWPVEQNFLAAELLENFDRLYRP